MNGPSKAGGQGALAGLLAAAGGIGASLLLANLLGSASSPPYALGSRVVDLAPGWLKHWAVEHRRIDVPRQFASVKAGAVSVAGVGYAQRRGSTRSRSGRRTRTATPRLPLGLLLADGATGWHNTTLNVA